jgi:hypothetical protein
MHGAELMDAASRVGAQAHSVLRWNIVLPVLVAILFFGAFTTVYILMRRPSFGERGAAATSVATPEVAPVPTRSS